MIDNNTLYGIVGTLLFTSFVIPFLKALFGPSQPPKIQLSSLTALPRMNAADLAYVVGQIIHENDGKYWLVSYSTNENNVATITFGYKEQGDDYKFEVMCCIDNTMAPKYPLNKRRKK